MPRGMDETTRTLTILALNERGDGVADDGTIAPGALPGERAVVAMEGARARLVEIRDPSPERAAPICAYFGVCGGCAAQHFGARLYGEWKRESLVGALKRARVAAEVGKLIDAHGEGRRRATFHARVGEDGRQRVGFMRARAHEIVAIEACPLFSPALAGAIPAARALAADLRGSNKPLDIQATASLAGLDFDLRGFGPLDAPSRRKLIETADRLDLARVSNHGELAIERRAPQVAFGQALVTPPPGGFLQATEAGERALAAGAQDALKGARRVADLFCGAGAFALRLAEDHEVFAADADADAAAIAALKRAAAEARGLRALKAATRDLFQRPLSAAELDAFDGVLFDPPRVGAEAQARALAASRTPIVVAISCNAESFARDARLLLEGGYAIGEVTPLDQFRFSPHVEILATFRRPPAKRRRRGLLG
jgi:23S rRNA (uracil1939-C5)-methyltransferase